MISRDLARRYRDAGFGLGGVFLKQSLYPRTELLAALDGADHVLDLGCGEGLLTNLLAEALPRARFLGVDLDAAKVAAGRKCLAGPNVELRAGNLFDTRVNGASAVIFNDVLHHLAPGHQEDALALAAVSLDDDGVLVLKEVCATDRLDRAHTTFWDSRLYPQDTLSFRPVAEWIALAGRHGFRLLQRTRVRHPWVASRSLLVFTKRPVPAFVSLPPALPAAPASPRVLLTGGTGFIGSWVLRDLLAHGLDGRAADVGVVTRRAWSLPPAVRQHPRVRVIEADLAQPDAGGRLGGPWDYVLHLAAEVDYFGGQATYRNNLAATTNLLAALKTAPPRRIVLASTMGAVDRARGDDCRQPLDENAAPHATSPYGRAKFEEENLVRASGLPFAIVRIPWCYGPGMSRSHHVRRLLNTVRKGGLATRFAWPGRVSLVPVDSAARVLIAAATRPTAAGQTFYTSDGEPVSFGELFAEMGAATGHGTAGQAGVPAFARWAARAFHFLLPFQLKALVCDALVVSDAKARTLGFSPPARPAGFLDGLARADARDTWPNRHRQLALVTGAASGIGRALARQLHARGHGLWLVDRDAAALAELAGRLQARHRVVDLASVTAAGAAVQLVGDSAAAVALVVNNAGLGYRGDHAALEPAKVEAMLRVNVAALVHATEAFTREMAARGGGTIVNIASSAAYQPLPYMAVYAASKAFVLSYTLAAGREQTAGGRVALLAVSPSGTRTNFQSTGAVKTNPGEKLLTPEATAADILAAIEARRPLTLSGGRARAMALFARVVPTSLLLRTWESLMRQGR